MTALLSRLSIRVTAPALLILPVLVASGVLIAIGTMQGHAAVRRLVAQQLAQIHNQIGQFVHSLVDTPRQVDQANAALIKSGHFDPATPRAWASVLIEQFRAFGVLSAITWGGEDGQCTWVARYAADNAQLYYAIKDARTGPRIAEYRVDSDARIAPEPSSSFDFDPRVRPWYVAPKKAGRPAWSEPFLWVGGSDVAAATLGIAFGWPCYDDSGNLIGVIDADLSLQDISRYLAGLRIGRSGRAYLVDSGGLLLASSSDVPLVDAAGVRARARDCGEAWVAISARHLADAFGSVAQTSAPYQDVINVEGRHEWLRASPFTHPTGLSWVIVTLVPESDFTAEIETGRRRSAWFAAGVTLATLGLGSLLALILVRPIVTLSRHVRRLGEGELEHEINLPYARELVRLSGDINRMTGDLRDRMELRRSLALAMEVQQSLLPTDTPKVEGLDIAAHSTYCDQTGGDYYDYLDVAELSSSTAVLAIGDVMGHGVAAAMLMATARGILRSRSSDTGSLGQLLAHLNDLLVEVTGGTRFMTMALVTIDAKRGQLRLASAGHDPPFIYVPDDDAFIELDQGGLPLGINAGEAYPEQVHAPLAPGSVVLIATDGVWEAQNAAGELFGKDRVRDLLRASARSTAQEISEALRLAVQTFCGEARQLDDITFIVARRV